MNVHSSKIKALGLASGGLDSILAALILREQGIDVTWIAFETPFFSAEKAREAAEQHNVPLLVKDITKEYVQMLKNPPAGYGRNMNPCMDCHALMFRLAGAVMDAEKFNFLFSGEVVGQRPMSQTKPSMRYVEKHSSFAGYILRPLSARLLPETIPEQQGWVDRSRLLEISGRGRKQQIQLAEKLGVFHYPNPAGGCLLTYAGFSSRLRDLFKHQDTFSRNELHLLKYGRHFRLDDQVKIIAGRTQQDNAGIIKYHNPDADSVLTVRDYPSPVVLVPDTGDREIIRRAASLAVGYSKAPHDKAVVVVVTTPYGREEIQVTGTPPVAFRQYLL